MRRKPNVTPQTPVKNSPSTSNNSNDSKVLVESPLSPMGMSRETTGTVVIHGKPVQQVVDHTPWTTVNLEDDLSGDEQPDPPSDEEGGAEMLKTFLEQKANSNNDEASTTDLAASVDFTGWDDVTTPTKKSGSDPKIYVDFSLWGYNITSTEKPLAALDVLAIVCHIAKNYHKDSKHKWHTDWQNLADELINKFITTQHPNDLLREFADRLLAYGKYIHVQSPNSRSAGSMIQLAQKIYAENQWAMDTTKPLPKTNNVLPSNITEPLFDSKKLDSEFCVKLYLLSRARTIADSYFEKKNAGDTAVLRLIFGRDKDKAQAATKIANDLINLERILLGNPTYLSVDAQLSRTESISAFIVRIKNYFKCESVVQPKPNQVVTDKDNQKFGENRYGEMLANLNALMNSYMQQAPQYSIDLTTL
ncbi:MAG: hypothetical protein AB7F64_06475 [Gammaproteobacteria bacterium]